MPYFKDFFDDFMRNSNLGIGVLHVKRGVYKTIYGSVFVIWLYRQKEYRPCDYDRNLGVLHKFQIDISTNSR